MNSRFTWRRCILNTRLHLQVSGHLRQVILIVVFTLPRRPRASSLCRIRKWYCWRYCFNNRSSWRTFRPLACAPEFTSLVNRTPCTRLHYLHVLGHLRRVISMYLPSHESVVCALSGEARGLLLLERGERGPKRPRSGCGTSGAG
jgi:hypothetical protein